MTKKGTDGAVKISQDLFCIFSISTAGIKILVPLLVLLWHAADLGWAQYWAAISDPRVVASYRVTLLGAFISTVVVTLVGLLLEIGRARV